MTFDDVVNQARARRAADAARADDRASREEREQEAGRRELAALVSEAWRVLSASGQPPAVEAVASYPRRGLSRRAVVRYTPGRSLRLLGSSGYAVTGQLELVRAGLLSDERLRETKFTPPPGRRAAWISGPVSLAMVYPSGYEDEFYVRDGVLVYGAEGSWSPPRAVEKFAQWVAESLDGS